MLINVIGKEKSGKYSGRITRSNNTVKLALWGRDKPMKMLLNELTDR